jgi:hypothetical protein
MNYETTGEMELALARYYEWKNLLAIPNIGYGLNLHECDLLVLSKSGYATEIEIKISKSDLKADQHKEHGHHSSKIKYLYFAVPEKLKECMPLIPERAGFITVSPAGQVTIVRDPQLNKEVHKFTTEDTIRYYRLGCVRIWSLRRTIKNLCDEVKSLK